MYSLIFVMIHVPIIHAFFERNGLDDAALKRSRFPFVETKPHLKALPVETCNEEIYKKGFPCDPDFEAFGDYKTCLYFSDTKKSKDDAFNDCTSRKATLVEINDAEFDQAIQKSTSFREYAILGINAKDDKWVYQSGDKEIQYTNWAGERPDPDPDVCIYKSKNTNGKWLGSRCSQAHFFICARPYVPTIHAVAATFIDVPFKLGDTIQTRCTVTGESTATVYFRILKGSYPGEAEVKHPTNFSDITVEDPTYVVNPEQVCVQSRHATLRLKGDSYYLNSRKVQCCADMCDNTTICHTTSRGISLKSVPRKPTLVVTFSEENMKLTAVCSPIVDAQGSMTWVLASAERVKTWTIPPYGGASVANSGVSGLNFSHREVDFTMKGLAMNHTMTLRMGPNFELHTIRCYSSVPSPAVESLEDLLGRKEDLWSKPYSMLKFESKRPTIEHARRQVGDTWFEDVACFAFVGHDRTLTWSLVAGDVTTSWYIKEDGRVTGQPPEGVLVQSFSPRWDPDNGAHFLSLLAVNLNVTLANSDEASLTCYSYNTSMNQWMVLQKSLQLSFSQTTEDVEDAATPEAAPSGLADRIAENELLRLFMWMTLPFLGLTCFAYALKNVRKWRRTREENRKRDAEEAEEEDQYSEYDDVAESVGASDKESPFERTPHTSTNSTSAADYTESTATSVSISSDPSTEV